MKDLAQQWRMMPRMGRISIYVLLAVAVFFGLRAGTVVRLVPESVAIERAAAVYVSQTGGARTDCFAMPSQSGAWLDVRCGDILYQVDAQGRVERQVLPDA